MHLLVGALIGAALGVIGAIVIAKVTGKPITWKTVVAGAVGGAVGGLITAATLGAGGAIAATATRTATAYIVGGAGSGAAQRATENELDGKPVQEGVVTATALGAASGAVFYGAGRVFAPALERLAGKIPFEIPGVTPPRPKLPEVPRVPEWESYPWKVQPPAKPGDVIRVKIADLRSRQATIDFGNGRYSETEFYDPATGKVSTDPTKGEPMIPEVSWVDWLPGEKPFWAVREGNHRTFDALVQGREDVLAKVTFLSQAKAEASLWGEREYAPFLKSGVWGFDETFMGRAEEFAGVGRGGTPKNPAPSSPAATKGLVGALGDH